MSEESNVTTPAIDGDPDVPVEDPTADTTRDSALFDDDEFGPPSRPSRLPRVTAALVVALLVVAGFVAGALVERNFGTPSTASDAFPPIGSGQLPDLGGASPGDTSSSGTGSAGSGRSRVIGTVASVHGDKLTVEDLGGAAHVFVVTDDTRIDGDLATSESTVTEGATVTVTAREGPDGSYTATAITGP